MKQPAFAALTTLPLLAAATANGQQRPNVVYIMTDQQSYYAISEISRNLEQNPYGNNPYFSTPNLDRLVQNGYTFSNCYAAHPVSGPSRFALLTGEAPNSFGMTGNFTPGGEEGQRMLSVIDSRGMGNLFKGAGYQTYYGGKCHLPWANGNQGKGSIYEPPYRYGFDNYLTDDDRDVLAQKGVEFFEEHKAAEPFLLFLSFMNPHDICMTQVLLNDRKLEDFTADEIDMRARRNQIQWRGVYRTMDKSLFETPELARLPFNMAPTDTFPLNAAGGRRRPLELTDFNARLHIWFYYRLIEQVDREIGMVLDALEKSPYSDNTVIVFTSDHGEMAYSHGLTGKNVPYEECQRVPLIFVGKDIPKGVIDRTTPVCNGWDLIPTMLDLADVEKPDGQKGVSLYKTMTKGEKPERKYLYYETVNSFGVLEDGRYKYTRFVLNDPADGTESLFDLEKDPGELFNLADKVPQARLDELRDALAAQMEYFVTSDAKITRGR